MRPLGGRGFLFLLLGLGMAALCLRLGFWQLTRLAQRRETNSEIRARAVLPAIELADVLGSDEDLAYRRAEGLGHWDSSYEIVLANRVRGGLPGAHLVTPLFPDGGSIAILVNRGWIPQQAMEESVRQRYGGSEPVLVRGMLRPAQEEPSWAFLADPTPFLDGPAHVSWRVLHIPWIQVQVPYPLARYYLELTDAPEGGTQPEPDPEMDLSDGPHLAYAIQWFLFSATALVGSATWALRRKRPAG